MAELRLGGDGSQGTRGREGRRVRPRSAAARALARRALLPLLASALLLSLRADGPPVATRLIGADSVAPHVRVLAAPEMEGRDSPSEGLRRAAAYLSERFREIGLAPAPDADAVLRELGEVAEPDPSERFLRPFQLRLPAPVESGCALVLEVDGAAREFALGRDFVPLPLCEGEAEGPLVFAGFGVSARKQRYDDLKQLRVQDRIVLLFEGAPRHARKFTWPDAIVEASLWSKLELLGKERAAGVLLVRRSPEGAGSRSDAEGDGDEPPALGFRHAFASFAGETEPLPPRRRIPALEISMDCASALLGTDAAELARRMDRSGLPARVKTDGRRVRLRSAVEQRPVRIDNVVGVLPGSDPALAGEYVVIGAHYDHIGVDPRGRIGLGADDNASGVACMLAVLEALSEQRPRRSILACAFAAEEKGLVGSRELCRRLPVEKERIVAMINLDMVGRGRADEVAVLGVTRNPALQAVLDRASRLSRTGVKEVVTRQGEELWRRSDHYSFHELGIPVLFFFEGLPIERNEDYHTWRDTVERVDFEKVARTARLVLNTAWILAQDDERPPPPRE